MAQRESLKSRVLTNSAPTTKRAVGQPLDLAFLALTLVGVAISSYLAWTHFAAATIICTDGGGCDKVNHSAYAYFPPNWGVPVSLLGLVGYAGLGGLGLWRWRQAWRPVGHETWLSRLDMGLFIATLGGVVFSAYLTAMELWVINAICWWCVASAVTVSLLFAISVVRIWTTD